MNKNYVTRTDPIKAAAMHGGISGHLIMGDGIFRRRNISQLANRANLHSPSHWSPHRIATPFLQNPSHQLPSPSPLPVVTPQHRRRAAKPNTRAMTFTELQVR